jgi:hypothetical protein
VKKKIALATTALVLSAGFVAAPATAAQPAKPGAGGACVQAGIATLNELGALQLTAQKKVDFAAFGTNGTGQIRLPLETGSFLSLGQVVSLHATNPGLFSWCD